ncbi:hypothetical protein [Haloplanus litoreus]|uniref:Uncharacterized protein n=1 Tax=Haloplanus litoreus TaxID=767515 RepID=A0ABD6A075_9EURY
MANDPDPETPVSVSTGEVRVGKTFEADRFPVPAIAFEIESLADDPIRIRLVDQIPESFAMEGVGFHPDYDSGNWTAYRDHRVAYERTLDPGESVLTVYGIRIDDPEEVDPFLDEPSLDLIEPDDVTPGSDEVLGRDTTQVVRDALSGGESSELSEMGSADPTSGPEPLLGGRDAGTAPPPRDRDGDLTAALGDRDDSVTAVETGGGADAGGTEDEADEADDAEKPETVASADAAAALDPRSSDAAEAEDAAGEDGAAAAAGEDGAAAAAGEDGAAAAAGEDGAAAAAESTASESEAGGPTAAPGSVAAALAAEIREGTVDDDDLAVLHEAFEGEVPTSVDVRVGRLQSQVEDVLAYRDALADFLDENGTAEEVLGDVSEEVSDLNDRIDALDESLSAAAEERGVLQAEAEDASAAVADASERVAAVEDELAGVESRLERLDERLEAVEALEDDIEDVRAELDDLRSFRDRLSSAFGTDEA